MLAHIIGEAEKSHDRLSVTEVSVQVQVFRSSEIDHITLRVRPKDSARHRLSPRFLGVIHSALEDRIIVSQV